MYLTHTDLNNYWILDIESDGLNPTVIWLAVVRNCFTGEVKELYNEEEFKTWYQEDYIIVGHNVVAFDIPVINKLWNCRIDCFRCIDTLVLSYLYNPKIDGGHSLEAWGNRLKFNKTDHSDWSKLTPEMVKYCRNDVELSYRLFIALTERMRRLGYSELSCEIEHKTAYIIKEQRDHGFYFNKLGGESLRTFLLQQQADLSKKIQSLFPPRRTKVAEYRFRRTASGRPHASYEKHRVKYPDLADGPGIEHYMDDTGGEWYGCYSSVTFNPGSPTQRIEQFLELGWEPTEFTEAGNPKVNEDEILKFAESVEEPRLLALAEWMVVTARLSMLAGNEKTGSLGWLGNLRQSSNDPNEYRIHGTVFSCGAGSRRMTHNTPNTANVPSPHKAKYGHEMRSLWGVKPNAGLIEVGVDAAGLENVGLLHYLPDRLRPEAEALLGQKKPNDVHSLNARRLTEALKRPVDREWGAKTSYYAALYGAYPPKLGQIVRGDKKDGQVVQDIILNSVPGLKELTNDAQYEWKHSSGRLVCIDGGFVVCPVQSAALNYRIQSLGAIVMKLGAILLREEAQKIQLWYKTVGTIHDEWQFETLLENGEVLGKLAVQSITRAAEQLKFKVGLSGEYKLGKNWSECH